LPLGVGRRGHLAGPSVRHRAKQLDVAPVRSQPTGGVELALRFLDPASFQVNGAESYAQGRFHRRLRSLQLSENRRRIGLNGHVPANQTDLHRVEARPQPITLVPEQSGNVLQELDHG